MNVEPQRADIVEKISSVLSGKEKRTNVSEWAVNIFDDDSLRISDPVVLNYIKLLGAVDLPSTDRDYLYTDEDLREWINEIERQ
ncbi:hypothetical protein [Erwinia pyrifoliae]|uniref:DNA-binding protein n=1 Tax=Erwinia pyrifoliae TaxID=79967 RepID=A0ABY5XAP4_ERWPY|nr:hypothetical protein [Erwinia pyrifoliae]MCT2387926.1 hypothetical protein [Erwinia pyrifoliae]MCT2387933.1 hypothetical protein [Erwinia pyrifoliae]UWS34480.1 hypothetical protein NYP84_04700 [Erwinia pyrifoliae]UWS34488.1 hypothetical protein NYP84_04740 [Erwinia pyrifoliae]